MRMSKEKIIDGVAVVTVFGKMMGGSDQIACHQKIKELIEEGRKWIVIDLGKVEWLNSSGLGLLIGCLVSCRNVGGEMVIARATKKVNSIFMMTQVIKTFDTYPEVDLAVAALKEKITG
jgi:anti-sigma B factor antagonist